MKKLLASLFLGALLVATGCNQSPSGGPGANTGRTTTVAKHSGTSGDATTTTTTSPDREVTDKANTFKLSGPVTETNLKQGEKKEFSISVSRGNDFKQAVKLTFNPGKGLKVTPENLSVNASDKEAKFFVEAMKDAPLGHTQVEVTGTPETGAATNLTVKVEVKEGGK